MKERLTEKELLALGFNVTDGEVDELQTYKWWRTSLQDLEFHYTAEYDAEGNFTGDYFEIGDIVLHSITKNDFVNMLQILRNGTAKL